MIRICFVLVIDCGEAPLVEYGKVVFSSGHNLASRVRYGCNYGYELIGNAEGKADINFAGKG